MVVDPNRTAPLSLAVMAAGAGGERFDVALAEALKNIRDPNTDAKAKRRITLTLELQPDESREIIAGTIDVKVTAPNMKKHTQPLFIEKRDGQLCITALSPQRSLDEEIESNPIVATITPTGTSHP